MKTKQYELDIQNVGEDVYMLMSKGHHDPHVFMAQARADGYEWLLGTPTHEWVRKTPAPKDSSFSYLLTTAEPNSRGAFPATYAREAYGDDQYRPKL
jgi:hypothetical protein